MLDERIRWELERSCVYTSRVLRGRCALGLTLLLACSPPPPAGSDGAVPDDAGQPTDAGQPPVTLSFMPFAPTAPLIRAGFVSDGTTVFTANTANVEVSTDVGRTWQKRALLSGQLALVGSTTVYLLKFPPQLFRSDDAAVTFTEVGLPAGVDAAASPGLSTTTDGTVWISLQTNPPAMYRSTDRGLTFTEVPLPAGTTVLRRCESFDGTWVASRNASELIRYDGAQWVTVAPLANAVACLVTPTGTVIANGRDTTSFQLRVPRGGAPERQPIPGFSFYLRQGSDLVRYLPSGQLDRSTDDGVTWTAQVATTPNGFAINSLAATGTTLLASTPQGLAELTAMATSWRIIADPGLPNFLRTVDLSFARLSRARALLLDDNINRTVFVSLDGTTWTRGLTMSQGEARVIALSPTGDQLFVAGTLGSYRILTDAGRTVLRTGTLSNDIGFTETNPAQQALWDGSAASSTIVVSTAKADDTGGELMALDPDSPFLIWRRIKPTSTTTSPAWRPGGYHALAISPSGGTLNRRLFTSFRTLISANSWNTDLLVWNQAFGSQAFWQNSEPPVSFTAATSASFSPLEGGPLAAIWSEGRLRIGTVGFREALLGNQFRDAHLVRFSNDGRLWLGGSDGLFVTQTPVTGL